MIPDLDHYLPENAVYIKTVRWEHLPESARLEIPPQVNAFFVLFDREGEPILMCDSEVDVLATASMSEAVVFKVH